MTKTNSHDSLMTPERQQLCRALAEAIGPFAVQSPNMNLKTFMSFLRVGVDEGKGVSEYADSVGTRKASMSRLLLDLGNRNQHGGEGAGRIKQERDREDLRVSRAYVSPKGADLIDGAGRAFKSRNRR